MLLTILHLMFKNATNKRSEKKSQTFYCSIFKLKMISSDQEQQPLLQLLRFQSR